MPDTTVVLGGTARTLVYDLNALCRLKKEQGINILTLADGDTDDPVLLRALVWGGLVREEPGLTVEQVGAWITLANIGVVSAAFAAAFERAVTPDSEAGQAALADPPAAPATHGITSSDSGTASAA